MKDADVKVEDKDLKSALDIFLVEPKVEKETKLMLLRIPDSFTGVFFFDVYQRTNKHLRKSSALLEAPSLSYYKYSFAQYQVC